MARRADAAGGAARAGQQVPGQHSHPSWNPVSPQARTWNPPGALTPEIGDETAHPGETGAPVAMVAHLLRPDLPERLAARAERRIRDHLRPPAIRPRQQPATHRPDPWQTSLNVTFRG